MDSRENEAFTNRLRQAVAEAERLGYRPHRFKGMINADGGFETVKRILASGKPSDGFTKLLQLDKVGLTCEAIIVESRWRRYFDDDLLARAENLLRQVGYPFKRFEEPGPDDGSPQADADADAYAKDRAVDSVYLTRKQFIESHGATCRNWTWSWSFVNEAERTVIFGAWDAQQSGGRVLILSEDWEVSRRGRKQPGYRQAREHIRLVEEEGYHLRTFPMIYSEVEEEGDVGPARIKGFVPKLEPGSLIRVGGCWYASGDVSVSVMPEELDGEVFVEGAAKMVNVNAYERNVAARAKCVEHHGYACAVCSFDFESTYGDLGKRYIHVHHVVPLAEMGGEYVVDPVKDLVPVCPNCHAMIHATRPCLSVEQLRGHIDGVRRRHCEAP